MLFSPQNHNIKYSKNIYYKPVFTEENVKLFESSGRDCTLLMYNSLSILTSTFRKYNSDDIYKDLKSIRNYHYTSTSCQPRRLRQHTYMYITLNKVIRQLILVHYISEVAGVPIVPT